MLPCGSFLRERGERPPAPPSPPNVHTYNRPPDFCKVQSSPFRRVYVPSIHPWMHAQCLALYFPFPTFAQPRAKYVASQPARLPRTLRKRHRCHESIQFRSLVTFVLFQPSYSIYPTNIPQELSTVTCVIAFNAPIALFTSSPATFSHFALPVTSRASNSPI
jgi:hypothetical protein